MPEKPQIAFCFLLYDKVEHKKIWETFFSQDTRNSHTNYTHNIYSHVKKVTDQTPTWIKKNQVKTIKTEWCEENLVYAWIKMLKKAFENKNNKYFVLLSGECIPLFTYPETYKMITSSKKSRVNIDIYATLLASKRTNFISLYNADQWVILNRKCAKILMNLKYSKKGRLWVKEARKLLYRDKNDHVSNKNDHELAYVLCPDEIFPVNWLVYNLGAPSSNSYKKEIRDIPSTYTFWDPESNAPHPVKFNLKKLSYYKKKICESNAIFGRKFYKLPAKKLALSCGK